MADGEPADVLWDTTLASRIRPGTELHRHVVTRAGSGDPVRVAAPAVLEVTYGLQIAARADSRFRYALDWFGRVVATDTLAVVPLDGRAAFIAGRLRGEAAHPGSRTRTDRRSKTMRQASWLMDIEIAAIAFSAGLAVATDNRGDFEALGEILATLHPAAPALTVVSAPA